MNVFAHMAEHWVTFSTNLLAYNLVARTSWTSFLFPQIAAIMYVIRMSFSCKSKDIADLELNLERDIDI